MSGIQTGVHLPRGFTMPRLNAPCVEPVRRKVGGRYGWAVHRFPIKGGVSLIDAATTDLRESAERTSSLWRLTNGNDLLTERPRLAFFSDEKGNDL